ncbi:DUF3833 domain-containing protein [Pseudoalteromonas byunsanensis]|uniref:DUF3833 domain-containing protein n=1 Tax=Pseudoalteromonas byunsanensis TaxID=327939 RepID=A0A1S1N5Y5_9GAMM|nr:DUF3833 domain-containing protein [Pseudoalteromonas byunsanensis]OHU93653.1 hypothetical protein BIW53_20170 [Pseudoalteromonas byunsanensis]
MFKTLTVFLLTILLAACGISIDANKYQNIDPQFDPFEFFNGKVKAWGIVQDRSGDMIQRFTVEIDGRTDGTTLTLDETFHYEVGQGVTHRVWKISAKDRSQLQGSANDILGQAKGQLAGNVMRWQYEMSLPVDKTSYTVQFDDWIWAFEDNTIINRSYIKKFGIVMAEVTIFMQKTHPEV